MADDVKNILQAIQRRGVNVPPAAEAALRKNLEQFGAALDEKTKQEFIQKFLDGLKSIIKPQDVLRPTGEAVPEGEKPAMKDVTEGQTPSSLVGNMTKLLRQFENPQEIIETMNLPFKIDVATSVMRGGARFVSQNFDQEELDAIPALELLRVYDRDVPRGFKRGLKGSIIAVPAEDWPHRWQAAATAAGDEDALRVFQETSRMVALKSSGIWQALGDGAGGYDDTLGNAFPPFAFNSGYDVDAVSRKDAEQLGLIDPGETAKRAPVDFAKLFSLAE